MVSSLSCAARLLKDIQENGRRFLGIGLLPLTGTYYLSPLTLSSGQSCVEMLLSISPTPGLCHLHQVPNIINETTGT